MIDINARGLSADDNMQLTFGVLATLIAAFTLLVAIIALKCCRVPRKARERRQSFELPQYSLSPTRCQAMRVPPTMANERGHDNPTPRRLGTRNLHYGSSIEEHTTLLRYHASSSTDLDEDVLDYAHKNCY